MCIAPKQPKIDPVTQKVKDPAIIRNPYLDGIDPKQRSMRTGRSSLRIKKGGGRGTAPPASVLPPNRTPNPIAGPSPIAPRPAPIRGGGGGGGRIARPNIRIH